MQGKTFYKIKILIAAIVLMPLLLSKSAWAVTTATDILNAGDDAADGIAGAVNVATTGGVNTITLAGSSGNITSTAGTITTGSGGNAITLNGSNGAISAGGTFSANGATNNIGTTQASANSIGTFAGSSTTIGDVSGTTGITGSAVTINTANTSGLTTTIGSTNASAGTATVQAGNSALSVGTSSASLEVQNATTGENHGISINQTNTVISGGTHSTSLTLDDNGATLSNDQTGGPTQLHGVANGTSAYDAVNLGQLNGVANRAYAGVASAIAMANIPAPAPGKNYAIGVAYGNYSDQDAVAIGVKAIVLKDVTLSVDYAYANTVSSVGAGVSYSF